MAATTQPTASPNKLSFICGRPTLWPCLTAENWGVRQQKKTAAVVGSRFSLTQLMFWIWGEWWITTAFALPTPQTNDRLQWDDYDARVADNNGKTTQHPWVCKKVLLLKEIKKWRIVRERLSGYSDVSCLLARLSLKILKEMRVHCIYSPPLWPNVRRERVWSRDAVGGNHSQNVPIPLR